MIVVVWHVIIPLGVTPGAVQLQCEGLQLIYSEECLASALLGSVELY